jgi:hypothetical protein
VSDNLWEISAEQHWLSRGIMHIRTHPSECTSQVPAVSSWS